MPRVPFIEMSPRVIVPGAKIATLPAIPEAAPLASDAVPRLILPPLVPAALLYAAMVILPPFKFVPVAAEVMLHVPQVTSPPPPGPRTFTVAVPDVGRGESTPIGVARSWAPATI